MLAKKINMYSALTLIKKYLHYYIKASNGKGHGVHSPFVYSFIREVLMKSSENPKKGSIETRRKHLLQSKELVSVIDLGAGSRQNNSSTRKVKDIAKSALKPVKYSDLLYKIVHYFKPEQIVEMGTSLGITTCYLAAAAQPSDIVTMEGAPTIAAIAKDSFLKLGFDNIKVMEGNFDEQLPLYLNSVSSVGLVYIDGNHKYEPTMRYFNMLLNKINLNSILIFDDIHWSKEMEQAWEEIKEHPSVRVTIDLFFIGLVFFRKEQKEKEHFIIRY
jgi:predicted O-methyltransferase YrrM